MQIGKSREFTNITKKTQTRAKLEPGTMPPANEVKFSTSAKVWAIVIIAALLIVLFLRIAEILPPFIWALVTSFIFNDPLNGLARRTGWPRWVWVTILFLAFFALVAVLLFTVVPTANRQVSQFSKDIPAMRQQLDDYLAQNDQVNIAGVRVSSETIRNALTNFLDTLPARLNELGLEAVRGGFHIALAFVVYLIATLYMMLIGSRAVFGFINSLPRRYQPEVRNLVLRIDVVLGAYIKGQFLLITIMSVSSFIILTILGVRYAVALAIMVGVLELIPFIGPYLAISICSAVAFFQPNHAFGLPALVVVILVAVALFVLRQIEDYAVIPNIIGRIVELPPLLIIFSVLAGEALLGPMGLLLAVPIVATLKIIVGYIFYKIVDADREKVVLPENSAFPELLALVNNSEGKRLLVGLGHNPEYLQDPANLHTLQQTVEAKNVDLALNCGNERLGQKLRLYGFSIIEMPQEHYATNTTR